MSEPTCRPLCYSGADCLSGVGTYLPGTVIQGCRLFKGCRNLPAGHCVTVVKTVEAVSEPTYRVLCYIGAGCMWLISVSKKVWKMVYVCILYIQISIIVRLVANIFIPGSKVELGRANNWKSPLSGPGRLWDVNGNAFFSIPILL